MARSAKRFVCVLMSLQYDYANNRLMRNTARQCFGVKQFLIVQTVLYQYLLVHSPCVKRGCFLYKDGQTSHVMGQEDDAQ